MSAAVVRVPDRLVAMGAPRFVERVDGTLAQALVDRGYTSYTS